MRNNCRLGNWNIIILIRRDVNFEQLKFFIGYWTFKISEYFSFVS